MQYTINKAEKGAAADKKRKLMVIGGISLVVALVAVIIFMVYKNISHPNTYEELLPMMDDAMAFDSKMNELSKPFDSIEDQVGEDAYFRTLEKDFTTSAEKQIEVIAEVDRVEAAVVEMGGITTYDQLQRVKQPATDSFVAKEYETQYGN